MSELPIDQIRTLLAAVDEGTFEAAARALHVTPSAISQRIKALEQRVGRVLVQRTKPVRLTESGKVLARYGRQVAVLAQDAHLELGLPEGGRPTTLPVAVNADSLATWFPPALARVPDDPPVCFTVLREDQDHTTELLREGLVLAAVTSTPEPVQGCSVHPLGVMRYRAMATRAFAARWLADGPPGLPDAPVVVFDVKDDLQHRFCRELTGRPPSVRQHLVPASEAYVAAVLGGLGWGMVPDLQTGAHEVEGRLVELVPGRPLHVPLYWQQWRLDSPPLAALAEAVARTAAEALRPVR